MSEHMLSIINYLSTFYDYAARSFLLMVWLSLV